MDHYRMLITGSRDFYDRQLISHALLWARDHAEISSVTHRIVVVHGACNTGADRLADDCAQRWGWDTEHHPARWDELGHRAGPVRNGEMVDLGADICLAFPIGASRGTRDCVGKALIAGIPVWTPNDAGEMEPWTPAA